MRQKVLVIDTSILLVWFQVPGKETCGPDGDRWDHERVRTKLDAEEAAGSLLVLPLASIIETGNHIAQAPKKRRDCADRLARLMSDSADARTPWAAFSLQSELWSPEKLKSLAAVWPALADQRLSLGDATIKDVAEFYAALGHRVEIFTGDQGLKAYEPIMPPEVPRRRRRS